MGASSPNRNHELTALPGINLYARKIMTLPRRHPGAGRRRDNSHWMGYYLKHSNKSLTYNSMKITIVGAAGCEVTQLSLLLSTTL